MARRSPNYGARTVEAGARKWGTGINHVHSINLGNEGRNVNVNLTQGGTHAARVGFEPVTKDITDSYWYLDSAAEDSPWTGIPSEFDETSEAQIPNSGIYGYTDDSGTSDRPDLGVSTEQFRGTTRLFRGSGWPSWGRYTNGLPGGSTIRDRNHGATVTKQAKENPSETVTEGWRNKERGPAELTPSLPNPEQLIMQTSMMQRYATRKGSQRSGTQSIQEPAHAIESRQAPPKVKAWSGEERHYDMLPKAQDEVIRPWWSRRAGTAAPELLQPNDFTGVTPMIRNPPADPFQGNDVNATAASSTVDYGYTGEDILPYV